VLAALGEGELTWDLLRIVHAVATGRSPKWPAVRRAHLILNPTCAACGGDKKIEVHHCVPISIDRSLELSRTNLISLCECAPQRCHLRVGHHGAWRFWNPSVREDASKMLASLTARS
jgi:5-methylcytosine-specific restriction protein A